MQPDSWVMIRTGDSAATFMQDALRPAQDAAEGVIQQLARLVSQQPDLQFPIPNDRAQTWLINTYLDEVLFSLPHCSSQHARKPEPINDLRRQCICIAGRRLGAAVI